MNEEVVACQWGLTEQKIVKSSFLWKIKNFSYIAKSTGERIESPNFSIKPDDQMQWYLAVYPFGSYNDYKSFVSASFCSRSTITFLAEVEFTISIVNSKNELCNKKSKRNQLRSNSFDGFNEFIKRDTLTAVDNDLLVNDVLTIFCEFTISRDIVNSLMKGPSNLQILEGEALDSFEQQFENESFSDFTLTAPCGKQLRVHKFVLASRSPVFSAMINGDMKERRDNAVEIKETDYASLKELLRFMYTAKVRNLTEESVGGILAAAEKYQVAGLKKICGEYLSENLSIKNAIETCILSDRYNIPDLKTQTNKFMMCHAKDVVNTEGFKSLDDQDFISKILYMMVIE